jgi:coniferyl-aldehyde dehydrogenase
MELNLRFNKMQAGYRTNPYPSLKDRKQLLIALKKILQNEAYTLTQAISKDFSYRSEQESLFLEIFPTIKTIDYCLKNMKTWMKNRPRNVSWMFMPAHAYLAPQPLGVIGNMVPWNYPVYLALAPVVYALAAGNRVMIKMSELSINTGLALESLLQSSGLEEYIQIINGDVAVAKQFASLPFGHLLFTGSTSVGKSVMQAASQNLTPVTIILNEYKIF